jgi:Flp pilus assembly protein TadD
VLFILISKILGGCVKRLLFIVCMLGVACNCAFAGEYSGLTPGQSTIKQANEALGKPLKISADGLLYDYSTEGHELSKLSITLAPDKNTVSRINLVFQTPYEKSQVKEWFGLGIQPDSTEMINGKLVELYLDQGIKIVHQSDDENSMIVQLSHIDPDQPEAPKAIVKKTEAKKESGPDPKKAEEFAKQADPYIAKDDYAGAIPYIEKAAYHNPGRVIYSSMLSFCYLKAGRLEDAVNTAKKVIAKNEDYIAYSVLGNAYFQKKDYKAAIPYLEKAVSFKQDETKIDNLQFLGACYYEQGQLEKALDTFVKAYKRNKNSPLSIYYLGVVSDRLGNNPDAKFYYKKYLRTKHNNSQMNKTAKERLAVVSRNTGKKSKNSFFKAVNMIRKEMKDF